MANDISATVFNFDYSSIPGWLPTPSLDNKAPSSELDAKVRRSSKVMFETFRATDLFPKMDLHFSHVQNFSWMISLVSHYQGIDMIGEIRSDEKRYIPNLINKPRNKEAFYELVQRFDDAMKDGNVPWAEVEKMRKELADLCWGYSLANLVDGKMRTCPRSPKNYVKESARAIVSDAAFCEYFMHKYPDLFNAVRDELSFIINEPIVSKERCEKIDALFKQKGAVIDKGYSDMQYARYIRPYYQLYARAPQEVNGISAKEISQWFAEKKISLGTSLIKDQYLVLIGLTFASLPAERYEGITIYTYDQSDDSYAQYVWGSDKMGFNMANAGFNSAFDEIRDERAPENKFVILRNFTGVVMHELAHREEAHSDCSDFYRISWHRFPLLGMIPWSGFTYHSGDDRDFAYPYGERTQYEDHATVVETMTSDPKKLMTKAAENLMTGDSDLADKIVSCYRFYGGNRNPNYWMVGTHRNEYGQWNEYMHRIGNETWRTVINGSEVRREKLGGEIKPGH